VARDKGLEGIVAKLRTSPYVQKRSREWLKIKITRRQECVIAGYTEPKGSREALWLRSSGVVRRKRQAGACGVMRAAVLLNQTHAALWKKLNGLKD